MHDHGQVIRRDVKGTDNYHDKAYFLEAWSLDDTGQQIDGFVTPSSWFAADRIDSTSILLISCENSIGGEVQNSKVPGRLLAKVRDHY